MNGKYPLRLGCTAATHKRLGVNAVINARAGLQELNDFSQDELEQWRDGEAIRRRIAERVRWYGPASRFFRRNRKRIEHLISERSI